MLLHLNLKKQKKSSSAKDLPEADPLSVASNIALRQLSHSPKTAHQLTAALLKRGVSPGTAATVVGRMAELGYIDDLAYARMFIRSKTIYRHLSKRALAYELNKCGVDKDLIEQAISELPNEQELETARALVAKKLRAMSKLTPEVAQRRLLSALARKGYSSAVSLAVIAEVRENLDS